jgi:7-cyano-7-deazaguanine synthase
MQPRGLRKVLLFSTGLDSFILSKLFSYSSIVFIKTGTDDNKAELARLQTHFNDLHATVVDCSFLEQYELGNKIIPFRNHIFACVAAQYGHVIHMASTAGDTTRDKDITFASTLSTALSYFSTGPANKVRWPGNRTIALPLRTMTKKQIVRLYLDKGFDADDLVHKSASCYHPTPEGKECGRCRSCLRKFVALFGNGVLPAFAPPPVELLRQHWEESVQKGRELEAKETQEVLCTIEA